MDLPLYYFGLHPVFVSVVRMTGCSQLQLIFMIGLSIFTSFRSGVLHMIIGKHLQNWPVRRLQEKVLVKSCIIKQDIVRVSQSALTKVHNSQHFMTADQHSPAAGVTWAWWGGTSGVPAINTTWYETI